MSSLGLQQDDFAHITSRDKEWRKHKSTRGKASAAMRPAIDRAILVAVVETLKDTLCLTREVDIAFVAALRKLGRIEP
jgi:hypothetical protein